MLDFLTNLMSRLRSGAYDPLAVAIELVLIGLCVNWVANVLQGTRGTRPLRGVLIALIVATLIVRVMAVQMGWVRLDLLYRYLLMGLAFIALVAFQPELRRAVIRLGDVRFGQRYRPASALIAALVKSAGHLSKNHFGGLIAIQRTVDLRGWAENGTLINAECSANLLNSIFFPNSPLHDLGVIIRGNRVVAANCQFPSAESDEVDTSLGSRHLAALGMSYETDALVLVVSEESGIISLADGGKLIRYLSVEDLATELETRLAGAPGLAHPEARSKRAMRIARRTFIVVPLTLAIWYLADQATLGETKLAPLELQARHDNPQRIVDVLSPRPPVFSVTVRGPTRTIDRLRISAAEPHRFDWNIPDTISPGVYSYNARQILEGLPGIRSLGLSVVNASPETLDIRVDDVVQVRAKIEVDSGPTQVTDVAIDPPEINVTLRRRDAERLDAASRTLRAKVEGRVAQAAPGSTLTFEKVTLPTDLGGVPLISLERPDVRVELSVLNQRIAKRIAGVPVRAMESFDTQAGFAIERADPMEWLIDVDVEGDPAVIESLQPKDISAYVTVSGDFAQSAGERNFRQADIVVAPPPGVIVKNAPRHVQLRLLPRPETTP